MLTVITATIMTVRSHLRIVYVTKRTSNGRANEQLSNIFFSKSRPSERAHSLCHI